jgi:hypothetical protein
MQIRVGCYGSMFLRLGFLFEKSSQIDLHVYISPKDFEKYKDELDGDPNWLHVVRPRYLFLIPGIFWFVNRVRYDIHLLSQNGLLLAFPHNPNTTIFHPTGYDLTVVPFPSLYVDINKLKRPINLLIRLIRSFLFRVRLRQASEIWATPFPTYVRALEKLNLVTRYDAYFPTNINMKIGTINKSQIKIKFGVLDGEFIVFNPNRFLMKQSPGRIESGHLKGNDISIKAFAKFTSECNGKAKLLLIDKGGEEELVARELIESFAIEDKVIWVNRHLNKNALSRAEMSELYEISDAVFGEFGVGWFGLTTIEAAYFAKPIICYSDENIIGKFFDINPFLSSVNIQEISNILNNLFLNDNKRIEYGTKSKAWFNRYFSDDAVRNFWQDKFSIFMYEKLNN